MIPSVVLSLHPRTSQAKQSTVIVGVPIGREKASGSFSIANPLLLQEHSSHIRTRLHSRAIANRPEIRQGVVRELLNELRWPVFDTGESLP